jgi:hypothetical protein
MTRSMENILICTVDPWPSFGSFLVMMTYFGTLKSYRRSSAIWRGDHGISTHFWILFGFLGICNGNGMSTHGFTHV